MVLSEKQRFIIVNTSTDQDAYVVYVAGGQLEVKIRPDTLYYSCEHQYLNTPRQSRSSTTQTCHALRNITCSLCKQKAKCQITDFLPAASDSSPSLDLQQSGRVGLLEWESCFCHLRTSGYRQIALTSVLL